MKRHRWDCINDRIKHIENPVGAEIGVHRGECSGNLLTLHPGLKLYMIDTWSPDTYNGKGDDAATEPFRKIYQENYNENYEAARKAVLEYADRVVIYGMHSVDTANLFPDGMFDFVFVDGAHDYESVKADIQAWLPKVKKSGYLIFHDYNLFSGVNQAVDEIFPAVELDEDYMCFVRV